MFYFSSVVFYEPLNFLSFQAVECSVCSKGNTCCCLMTFIKLQAAGTMAAFLCHCASVNKQGSGSRDSVWKMKQRRERGDNELV